MRTTRNVLTAVGMTLALTLAGCSSDGGSDAGGDDVEKNERETREEFIAAFNTRCAAVEAEIDEVTPPETIDELKTALAEVQRIQNEGVEDLRAMDIPEDISDDITTALDYLDEMTVQMDDYPELAIENDPDALAAFETGQDSLEDSANKLFEQAGIDCGPDSSGDATDDTADDSTDSAEDGTEDDSEVDTSDFPPGDPIADIAELGQNADWDRAATSCEEGLMAACDALTAPEGGINAPEDTEMFTYGATCGGRVPPKGDRYCGQLTFSPGDK